ncbi:MAG: acetyl-CoA carboxylase biotin carboxyl carrier protein [Candidatus Zixiibacteriota bacterium]
MNSKTIRRLIAIVEESQIDVLEVSNWWRKVKITRSRQSVNGQQPEANAVSPPPQRLVAAADGAPAESAAQAAPVSAPSAAAQSESTTVTANLVEIKSPMVGTFYAAPSPESPSFVKVGDTIGEGTVVCIVEAMKLMNEIESEVKGVVKKALAENAQPVEFGQPLFLIDTSA